MTHEKKKAKDHEESSHKEWYEKLLPKPPLPTLSHTLNKYLEYVEVLAKNDRTVLSRTERAVSNFRKTGNELQLKLQKLTEDEDNWINRFWLPEMYLRCRLPLPIYANPAYIFPKQTFTDLNEQLKYTSWLIKGFCEYKNMIDIKTVDREMSTGRNKVIMCMNQYDRILSCYREPSKPMDVQYCDMKKSRIDSWNEHIIVMYKNQTFVLHTRVRGKLLSQADIERQLQEIIEMGDKHPSRNIPRVSGGSVGHRDDAAEFWKAMKQMEINRQSLEFVIKSMFIVCIDIMKPNETKEISLDQQGLHLLHGFGSQNFGLNRWYDATLQIVVASNGTNGLCIEHSVAEGIVIINMAEYAIRYARKGLKYGMIEEPITPVKPQQIQWALTDKARKLLTKEVLEFDKLTDDVELRVLVFEEFGKDFLKSCLLSPDAFIQLCLQLAHYRVHGYLTSTYESASIRRFRLGRVENIRAATKEALAWIKAMMDDKPVVLKRKLFDEAIKKQTHVTLENITGYGIDNHLYALNVLAKEEVSMGRLEKLPDIFTDPMWEEMMRFPLSTSQVTTATDIQESYLCYGPVVEDGYGCSYNLQPNKIIFAPSALRSCPCRNIDAFTKAIRNSLLDMKVLFV